MTHDHSDICAWTQERLELFLDGELSGSENLRFQTHIKECDFCASYWADDEAVSEALLVAVAPEMGAVEVVESNPEFVQSVFAERVERPITHHSSSVVFVGRNPLLWSGVSAIAASIVTALVCFNLVDDSQTPTTIPVVQPVNEVASLHATVGFAQGTVQVRPITGGEWLPVSGQTRIDSSVDVKTSADSRLLLEIEGERGQVLLEESSQLRIAQLPNTKNKALELELDAGRVSCDLRDVKFRAGTTGLDFEGANASFDLTCGDGNVVSDIEARLSVIKGEVLACGDIGAEQSIGSGNVFAVKHGVLMSYNDFLREQSIDLVNQPNAFDRGSHFDSSPPAEARLGVARAGRSKLSRRRIENWLNTLSAKGRCNFVDPSRLPESTKSIFTEMKTSGELSLPLVNSLLEKETNALRRRALVHLIGQVKDSAKATEILKRTSFDESPSVRRASLYSLSSAAGDHGKHFLDACSKEKVLSLRLLCAFLAAREGHTEGVDEMLRAFKEKDSKLWEAGFVELMARLKLDSATRVKFLKDTILKFKSLEDKKILRTASRGLASTGHKNIAIEALRSLQATLSAGHEALELIATELAMLQR